VSDLICIKKYETRAEAELAGEVLAAAGIESLVGADDCAGWLPPLTLVTGGARLLVNKDDELRACKILEEFDRKLPGNDSSANAQKSETD